MRRSMLDFCEGVLLSKPEADVKSGVTNRLKERCGVETDPAALYPQRCHELKRIAPQTNSQRFEGATNKVIERDIHRIWLPR